jgi:sulfite exporter TauE/SafE
MGLEVWSAFVIGLAGSLHCIGMCGPIAVALPTGSRSRLKHVLGRVAYNAGRVVTYSLLGLITGLVGRSLNMAGLQQGLSIALGGLIIVSLILPSRFGRYLTGARVHEWMVGRLKSLWRRFLSQRTVPSLFVVGILNGFLPCGLVYVAIAGALALSTGPVSGMVYMALFGLGTFPVMLAVSMAGSLIGLRLRRSLTRLLPVGAALLAVLFVLRGLSLGIPYVSPRINHGDDKQVTMDCHHHESEDTPSATKNGEPAQ